MSRDEHGSAGVAMPLALSGLLAGLIACSDDGVSAETSETTETGDEQGPLDPCDPGPSSVDRPELDWRVDYDQPGSEIINGLAVRPGGGVVAVGQASGSMLALELDASGEQLWRVELFSELVISASRVVLDEQGNSYVAGRVVGALEGQEAGGESDVFMLALSPTGELLWARQWGTAADELDADMVMGAPGQLLLTGDTDAAFAGEHQGNRDAFLIHVDTQGELVWERQWGSPYFDWPRGIAANCEGESVVVGITYTADGDREAFAMRFDSSGEQQWTRLLQGEGDQSFLDVALLDDAVYAVGSVTVMEDFNNSSAGLAAAYDASSGEELWTQEVGVLSLGKLIPAGDALIVSKSATTIERLEPDGSWGWNFNVEPVGDLSSVTGVERGPDGAIYVASLAAGDPDRNAMIARLLPAP